MIANRCNDERLCLLLSEDEASDAFRDAAAHVESCATCQSRLTTLAGEASLWSEAHALLSGESEPRWEPDASGSLVFTADGTPARESVHDAVLELLGTPNHPEMLGRLGRYDIERVIGSGGMGVVLKAHDSELNRPIAVKLLAPHLAHVGAARERFAREGRAAAAVVHEHVVAIYNVETDGRVPFLVMQYVPGRSLQSRVEEDGPLAVEEILRIGMQAASGLAAAHRQGLVHRDVKPSNILLEDTVERAVLTDFGLARTLDDASLTQTGILAGTPHYMSPEQATGGPIDHRSDLFSLGAVLYFMATGHPPFRASGALAVLHRICREPHRPAWQSNKDLPDELSDVIDKLLEKKPGRRFADADEVQQELAALLSRVQRYGLARRRFRALRTRPMRRRVLAAVATLSLVAGVGAGAWYWASEQRTDTGSASIAAEAQALEKFATKMRAAAAAESEFTVDLEASRAAIGQLDRASYYLRSGEDTWSQEVETLRRTLAEIESQNNLSP